MVIWNFVIPNSARSQKFKQFRKELQVLADCKLDSTWTNTKSLRWNASALLFINIFKWSFDQVVWNFKQPQYSELI